MMRYNAKIEDTIGIFGIFAVDQASSCSLTTNEILAIAVCYHRMQEQHNYSNIAYMLLRFDELTSPTTKIRKLTQTLA